jgi:hypothetical protein
MSKLVDLTGKRFFRLIVLKRADNASDGKTQWECKCDCGNVVAVRGNNLKSGHTGSCGCLYKEVHEKTKATALSNLEHTAAKCFLREYKKAANSRGYLWALSDEQALLLALSECHYCGAPPAIFKKVYRTEGKPNRISNLAMNGIDRKDNSLGYTKNNSMSCCKRCNYAKRDMSYNEFISYLEIVTNYRK